MQFVTWRVMVREAVLDEIQVLAFDAVARADALVHELDEAGDDRERAVDVMDDAGVNFAAACG